MTEANHSKAEPIRGISAGVVVHDADTRITQSNAAAQKLLGVTGAQLLGKDSADPTWHFLRADGTAMPEEEHPVSQVLANQQPLQDFVAGIQHADSDDIVWVLVSAIPVFDDSDSISQVIVTFVDISPQRRAEAELQRARREWEEIFQAIGQPAMILDAHHGVVMANRAVVKATGISADDLQGKKCYEVFHGASEPPKECPFEKMLSSRCLETIEMELEALEGVFLVSCTPMVDDNGDLERIIHIATDITEQKRTERAVQDSEIKHKTLVRNIPGMVYRGHPDWSAEIISGCEEICGYTVDELHSQPENWGGIIHPDDRERAFREGSELAKRGGHLVQTYRIVAKDGGIRWVEDRKTSLFSEEGEFVGIDGVVFDITERRQEREELRKLALVVKHSGELVNLATLDGQMIFLNKAGGRMLGIDPEDVERFHIMDVIPDHWKEMSEKELVATLLQGETWEGELQYRNIKTGELTDVHAMTFPVPDPDTGKPLFLANVSLDITERKQLQRQLLHAQKLESISTLAAGVAHNFNNILTAILGNIELAKLGGGRARDVASCLERATRASDRGAQLTQQLLSFSRREPGEKASVSVSELLNGVSQTLGVLLDRNIEMRCSIADDVPHIMANYAEIEQVLMNMCLNAQDAMPKGGLLVIRADAAELSPEYCQAHENMEPGNYVKISISDTGMGMDDETLSQIFDPFFTTKGPDRGTGIGLSASYHAVASHGGCFEVESEVDRGTTFTLYLPATEKPEEDVASRKTAELITGSKTILIVDDEEMVLDILQESLGSLGYTVLTAKNGKDAIDIYRQHRERIDLVLLDYMMPELDGENTYHELRKIDPDVKVLVASGYDSKSKVKPLLAAGVNGFVQKPFDLFKLSQAVRDVLQDT